MSATPHQPLEFRLPVERIVSACFVAVAGFALANGVVQYCLLVFDLDFLGGFSPLFNLDRERTVPTWFSSVLLLSIAALLAVASRSRARAGDRDAPFWTLLAAVFLVLSADEASSGHELLTEPWADMLGVGGLLHFAWVVPVVGLLAVLALLSLGYVRRIVSPTRERFILAGVVYVGAAVGLELFGGLFAEQGGRITVAYAIVSGVEETFEMVGLVLMLRATLLHLRDHERVVLLRFGPDPGDEVREAGSAITADARESWTRPLRGAPGRPEPATAAGAARSGSTVVRKAAGVAGVAGSAGSPPAAGMADRAALAGADPREGERTGREDAGAS